MYETHVCAGLELAAAYQMKLLAACSMQSNAAWGQELHLTR
jgi:hypothetical protein